MSKRLLIVLGLTLFVWGCSLDVGEPAMTKTRSDMPAEMETPIMDDTGKERAADKETPASDIAQKLGVTPTDAEKELDDASADQLGERVTVVPGRATPATDSARPVEVTPSPVVPNALVKLVNEITLDLSKRLKIAVGEIELVEIKEVTWRDSSLGCPQPGMGYLMVLTEGYQIILKAQGKLYDYHTRATAQFVLCEK
jgi:hypothetical protein